MGLTRVGLSEYFNDYWFKGWKLLSLANSLKKGLKYFVTGGKKLLFKENLE